MSLINDALKKAQTQRSGAVSPPPPNGPPPGGSGPSAASSPAPAPGGKTVLLIAAAAVIVSLSVVTTVFLLREPSRPQIIPVSAQAIAVRTAPSPVPQPPGQRPTPAHSDLVPSPIVSAPAPNIQSDNMARLPLGPTPVIVPTAVPTLVMLPQPTPVKATVRIQALVDKFRISGIRLSDTDSKVILNDHLFRIDDPVEPSLGLKITKIEEHRLTFVDAEGNVYVKRL